GIERPFCPPLDDRDRERPVVVTDEKERASTRLRVDGYLHLLFGLCRELGSALSILRTFTGQHDSLELGPEDLLERVLVELRRGGDEYVGSLLWRIERSDRPRGSDGSRSACGFLRPRVERQGCET